MRTVASKIEAAGANLVLIGNGDVDQGRKFLEETETRLQLLVDPGLAGYRAASLERRLLAPYSPRGWLAGIGSILRGFKPGLIAGDGYQLGGTFVITPEQRVAYSFVGTSIYARAPVDDVVETLGRLSSSQEELPASTLDQKDGAA